MNRKEQIEKVILKEIKDMEFMKKIKNINSIYEAKKGKRPVMTGKFGAKVKDELAGFEAQNNGYVNPDALPDDPVKRVKVYRAAEAGKAHGGDAMDDKVDADFKADPKDEAENQEARKRQTTPVSPAEAKTAARLEQKEAKILELTNNLGQHIPAFAKLGSTKGKTPRIFDTEAEHLHKIIGDAHDSHPHLKSHLTALRTLLGM